MVGVSLGPNAKLRRKPSAASAGSFRHDHLDVGIQAGENKRALNVRIAEQRARFRAPFFGFFVQAHDEIETDGIDHLGRGQIELERGPGAGLDGSTVKQGENLRAELVGVRTEHITRDGEF